MLKVAIKNRKYSILSSSIFPHLYTGESAHHASFGKFARSHRVSSAFFEPIFFLGPIGLSPLSPAYDYLE